MSENTEPIDGEAAGRTSPAERPADEPARADDVSRQASQPDRTGDLLRKERLTRRISIETIARDLKLNAKYIKALEASQFDALPSDPYVRVYLRSIGKYLMMDPDAVLNRFYQERGIVRDTLQDDAEKIDVSTKQNGRGKTPWGGIAILIVVLAAILFVADRMGLITHAVDQAPGVADSTAATEATDSLPSMVQDTATDIVPAPVEGAVDTVDTAKTKPPAAAPAAQMRLVVSVAADSVWIQVYADGKSWKNYVRAGQPRAYTAADSFNVHVGNNSNVRYELNGEQVKKIKGAGVVVFKIDRAGVTPWTLQKWMSVFKSR